MCRWILIFTVYALAGGYLLFSIRSVPLLESAVDSRQAIQISTYLAVRGLHTTLDPQDCVVIPYRERQRALAALAAAGLPQAPDACGEVDRACWHTASRLLTPGFRKDLAIFWQMESCC